MSLNSPVRQRELTERAVAALAAVSAISVANGYYIQPLLAEVGADVALPHGLLGLLPALFQIGLALGLIALLPLADSFSARRVLLGVIPLQIVALLLIVLNRNVRMLMFACLAVGLFGITPYVLPPYASLHVSAKRLGQVTGMLTRGVICGILLARTVAGVVSIHLGWRSIYALGAIAMTIILAVVIKVVKPQHSMRPIGYGRLLRSLVGLIASEPELRTAALCQALSFGSFNVFWLGSTLYLHGHFGWRPDAIGYVGILGAAAAFCAPLFGQATHRFGSHHTRRAALVAMLVAWGLLAGLRESLGGMAVALIVLDLGATVSDISNRTILYVLAPEIRTRLNAVYTIAMFIGGGVMSVLVGLCWAAGGWSAVCALGALSAAAAMVAVLRPLSRATG